MAPVKRGGKSRMDAIVTSAATVADYDDDDVIGEKKASVGDHGDRKKQTHLRCERQRREAINNGYLELKELLPSSLSAMGCKTTNASILFRAADYIQQLDGERQKSADELQRLKSQMAALQVIAVNYEQLSSEQSSSIDAVSSKGGADAIDANSPTSAQWRMFRQFMDICFDSFVQQVHIDNYNSIARSLLSWLESVDFEAFANQASTSVLKHSRC